MIHKENKVFLGRRTFVSVRKTIRQSLITIIILMIYLRPNDKHTKIFIFIYIDKVAILYLRLLVSPCDV